jgi:hypothetical protein
VVQRWAKGWMIGRFESWQGLEIFPFTTASRLALVLFEKLIVPQIFKNYPVFFMEL